MMLLYTTLLLTFVMDQVQSRGRLIDPPHRGSLWRYGLSNNINYDDHGLNCGGLTVRKFNDDKCGVCGDAWDEAVPRPHESGGLYGQGTIARTYEDPDVISVVVDITSYRGGYFEFRLCPVDNSKKIVTQNCLDQHLLELKNSATRYYPMDNGIHFVRVKIPKDMECDQCVLQWKWRTASNWGVCENGTGSRGCGPQEEFFNCADIAIRRGKKTTKRVEKLEEIRNPLAASIDGPMHVPQATNKYFTTLRLHPNEKTKWRTHTASMSKLQRITTPHTHHINCTHDIRNQPRHWPSISNQPIASRGGMISDTAGKPEFMALGVEEMENEISTTTTAKPEKEIILNEIEFKPTEFENTREFIDDYINNEHTFKNLHERPEVVVSSVRHYNNINRQPRKHYQIFPNHAMGLDKYPTTIKRRSVSTQHGQRFTSDFPKYTLANISNRNISFAPMTVTARPQVNKPQKQPTSDRHPEMLGSKRNDGTESENRAPLNEFDIKTTNQAVAPKVQLLKNVKHLTKSPYRSSKYPWFDVKIYSTPSVREYVTLAKTNQKLLDNNVNKEKSNRALTNVGKKPFPLYKEGSTTYKPRINENKAPSWLDIMQIDRSTVRVVGTSLDSTKQPVWTNHFSGADTSNPDTKIKNATIAQFEEQKYFKPTIERPEHTTLAIESPNITTTEHRYIFGLGKIATATDADHSIYPAFGWSGLDFTKNTSPLDLTAIQSSTPEIGLSPPSNPKPTDIHHGELSFSANTHFNNPINSSQVKMTAQKFKNTTQHENTNITKKPNYFTLNGSSLLGNISGQNNINNNNKNNLSYTVRNKSPITEGKYDLLSKEAVARLENSSNSDNVPDKSSPTAKTLLESDASLTSKLPLFAAIQGYSPKVEVKESDELYEEVKLTTQNKDFDIRASTDFLMGVNRFSNKSLLNFWTDRKTNSLVKENVPESAAKDRDQMRISEGNITATGAVDDKHGRDMLTNELAYNMTSLSKNERWPGSVFVAMKTPDGERRRSEKGGPASGTVSQSSRLSIEPSINLPSSLPTKTSETGRCNRCYAIGMFRGNAVMDEFCDSSCKFGKCSPCACHCGCPEDILEIKCKPVGLWAAFPHMERWCYSNCCNDYCPSTHCLCTFRNRILN